MESIFAPVGGNSKTVSILLIVASMILHLFFICTGIAALCKASDRWHLLTFYYPHTQWYAYAGFQMDQVTLVITVVILILLAIAVLVFHFLRGNAIKDNSIFENLFGKFGRFFPLVLLFNSIMFLLTHFYIDNNNPKNIAIAGFVFCIVSTAILVLIYLKTQFTGYLGFVIKKGFFSALLCFNVYYIFYTIAYFAYSNKHGAYKGLSKIEDCSVGCGVVFGILALLGTFFFKDIVIGVIAMLVYIGLLAFRCDKSLISRELLHSDDKIVGGVFLSAVIIVIVVTIIVHKKKVLE